MSRFGKLSKCLGHLREPEYFRKGKEKFAFVGYLARMPSELHIPLAQANTPQTNEIKAIFSENNEEIRWFSDNKEIALS